MPRIRTPHEGRHRAAAQIVRAGAKFPAPEAGRNLPAPTAGLRRGPEAGLKRAPVAGGKFPSPTR